MILATLALAAALAQAPVPLPAPVAEVYEEARILEETGDLLGAELRYRTVLRQAPDYAPVALDLGRVREAQGDLEGAAEAYRQAPRDDVDAIEALGWLHLRAGDPRAAVEAFRRLAIYQTRSGEPMRLEALALAELDPGAAAARFQDYLDFHDPRRDVRAAAETAAAIARALPEEEAWSFVESVVAVVPEAGGSPVLAERLEWLRIEQAARRRASTAAQPLLPDQRERLEAARDDPAALEALREETPRSPEVWSAAADLHERLGEIAAADRALQVAEALAPFDPEYPARLGDLLSTWYGGQQDVAAAEAYGRALRLNPAWDELWWRKARVELRAGARDAAERSLRRYLALAPEGTHAAEARRLVEGAARERPGTPAVPEASGRPEGVPEEAWHGFWVAFELHERGRGDEALARLAEVEVVAPAFPRALNLQAAIHLGRGDRAAAIALYRRSLAADPTQELPRLVLWKLLREEGDAAGARALLRDAEARQLGGAHYLLAEEAWEAGRPWEARRRLDAYFARTRQGPWHLEAERLAERVDARIRSLAWGGGLGAGLLVVAVPGWWWWRRSGADLATLLDRAPRAFHDVARIGSAIRHEVLKHHTAVLPAVADALEAGDPDPAVWAAERLYGPQGAVTRFREHVRALEVLGRVHGVRLNLRRDPVVGPLIAAVRRLAALERDLRDADPRVVSRLRDVSEVLNQEGYRALGRLLERVCLLPLDAGTVQAAWDGSRPLEVEVEAAALLRIWRGDLDDILANLLRNAREAGAARIGVRVAVETDWVTGLERVAIRVRDDAPRRVTTELIRGRYIERGLGLTVDLISRNGGSVHVEDEPGWSKAVVVRLPRAEVPGEEPPMAWREVAS